ncbi:MAG: HAMP domain-containing histidine kinase [Elainella sp. Prado103]|jgi:signal transduction histidine kinase|nr:HAMP domain-containing histidine kinase [Elainella sp. Prado103]
MEFIEQLNVNQPPCLDEKQLSELTDFHAEYHFLIKELAKQKQIETELRQRNQELELELQQLHAQQTQLIQAEKMSSLEQLVAGIAHEINNPVNFIYGNLNPAKHYIQDLLNLVRSYQQAFPQATPEIQQQIQEIDLDFVEVDLPNLFQSLEAGTVRIQDIIRSLRTFSRLDEAEMKAADIHAGMDSTLMILKNRLKGRANRPEIEIHKDYAEMPPVGCYPGQLNQVFMNLLGNAIDALDESEKFMLQVNHSHCEQPRIEIKTELIQDQQDQWVQISISDNANGMPDSIRHRVFDPFFTTKPIGKGTGLGLSISYQIVTEKHGGKLHFKSVINQGTLFRLQIPFRPAHTEG